MSNKNNPPEFHEKEKSHSLTKRMIALLLCVAIISGLCGYLGGRVANQSNTSNGGINITQTTTTANKNSKVEDVSDIAAKAAPSVVAISTEIQSNYYGFFGQDSQSEEGAGSGVIISKDGYIVTNNHVISDATQIQVTTNDGKNYNATLVGADSTADLAVLKIDADNLTPATFGNSDQLEVGQAAIVIGNPLGQLGGTVTSGIISSLDRQLEIDGNTMTLLQTDAAVSSGNSGGGLFDSNGNLVGIVNAKASSTGNSSVEGIGFAIPINTAETTINELVKGKGSSTSNSSKGQAVMNVSLQSTDDGIYIAQVVDGGAGDKAGLKQGDKITKIDNKEVNSIEEAKSTIRSHSPGDTIKVTVERNGKEKTVSVTLEKSNS